MSTKSSSSDFKKFDDLFGRLVKVPHSELKTKLDAERRTKTRKRKAKHSASRVSGDKG